MSPEPARTADVVEAMLRDSLASHQGPGALLAGLCGAQGSGKSTLAAELARRIERTAVLSIDDLYRTRDERLALAHSVHLLLRTRGVPGTHDVDLGLKILDALSAGRPSPLPRFDKARDERAPEAFWNIAPSNTQLVILEGWCVGALPQGEAALANPVNELERDEDAAGIWRHHVNSALAGAYQRLFSRIDLLILLAAPGFEIVRDWRIEQEHALRSAAGADATAVMSDAEVERFIAHYERLTRHILAEMPHRADLTLRLRSDRSLLAVQRAR